ncbi:MAG: Gfo/Idh/MocA family oxidoreductase [Erysipelotrichaceae bacterium]|nr:Gfo/Idh/MocA family oxidoreductase [Erysipelotrichaceae bacterium]
MIKWGVLGLGGIATRFCESLANFDDACFYAGASFTESKRKAFDEAFHPVKLYDNYNDMLEDDDVDVIYIAVPHGFHYQWIMASLEHGKHVMTEKPATLTQEDIKTIAAYAKEHHLFFMEAMKARFIPLMNLVHQTISEGTIGDITHIENHFTFELPYIENHYMYDVKQGGTLYDAGCYGLAFVQDFIKEDVVDVKVDYVINYDVDVHQNSHITYANGATADCESAIDDPTNKRFGVITGTKGKITMNPFYRPEHADVELDDGTSFALDAKYIIDDFHTEIAEVHRCICEGLIESPRMSYNDSITYIGLMEQIKKAMK